jgi:signal peptidase II
LIDRFGTEHWPTFNVADSAIVVGAGLLLLDTMRSRGAPAAEAEGRR